MKEEAQREQTPEWSQRWEPRPLLCSQKEDEPGPGSPGHECVHMPGPASPGHECVHVPGHGSPGHECVCVCIRPCLVCGDWRGWEGVEGECQLVPCRGKQLLAVSVTRVSGSMTRGHRGCHNRSTELMSPTVSLDSGLGCFWELFI